MKKHILYSAMMVGLFSLYGCDKTEKPEQKPAETSNTEEAATLFGMSDMKNAYNKAKTMGNQAAQMLDKSTSKVEKAVVDAAKGTIVESAWNKATDAGKNLQMKVEKRIEESAADTAMNLGEGIGATARFLVPEKYKADVYSGAQTRFEKKAANMGQKMEEAKAEAAARAEARMSKPLPALPTPQ